MFIPHSSQEKLHKQHNTHATKLGNVTKLLTKALLLLLLTKLGCSCNRHEKARSEEEAEAKEKCNKPQHHDKAEHNVILMDAKKGDKLEETIGEDT